MESLVLVGDTSLVAQMVKASASAYDVGDLGSIPRLGRSPGEGNGNPHQYSCLENSMDGGAWWATVHGVAKSQTRLRDFIFWYLLGIQLLIQVWTPLENISDDTSVSAHMGTWWVLRTLPGRFHGLFWKTFMSVWWRGHA